MPRQVAGQMRVVLVNVLACNALCRGHSTRSAAAAELTRGGGCSTTHTDPGSRGDPLAQQHLHSATQRGDTQDSRLVTIAAQGWTRAGLAVAVPAEITTRSLSPCAALSSTSSSTRGLGDAAAAHATSDASSSPRSILATACGWMISVVEQQKHQRLLKSAPLMPQKPSCLRWCDSVPSHIQTRARDVVWP
jgi:hypothetical protein